MRWLEEERGIATAEDYQALWEWSVSDLEAFWAAIWEFFDVRRSGPTSRCSRTPDARRRVVHRRAAVSMPSTSSAARTTPRPRSTTRRSCATFSTMTWGELREPLTTRIAAGLRALGVGPGDRVAAYMPNIPETIAAFLATASIGAVWSSCSPDFGARSVVDRFAQIEPKVLLAVDGYRYNGRDFDRRETVQGIAGEIGARVVWLGYLDGSGWEDGFLGEPGEPAFEQLPFDHPLWVLYSSGTTGLPKAIVHGQGGILLEHLKKMHLHLDAQAGDRVFWFTTTGWMMWNFLVGVLLTDAEIVLYDGSPGHPDLGVLWDLAERTGMTCFGTSAAYMASCMKDGVRARGRARPERPAQRGLHRIAAVARGLSVGL